MPDKRSLSPDSACSDPLPKRQRSDSIESWDGHSNQKLRVFVVQAKLDEKEIAEMYNLVESHGPGDHDGLQLELCSNIENADVVVTAIRMPKRLQRHVDWPTAVRITS